MKEKKKKGKLKQKYNLKVKWFVLITWRYQGVVVYSRYLQTLRLLWFYLLHLSAAIFYWATVSVQKTIYFTIEYQKPQWVMRSVEFDSKFKPSSGIRKLILILTWNCRPKKKDLNLHTGLGFTCTSWTSYHAPMYRRLCYAKC